MLTASEAHKTGYGQILIFGAFQVFLDVRAYYRVYGIKLNHALKHFDQALNPWGSFQVARRARFNLWRLGRTPRREKFQRRQVTYRHGEPFPGFSFVKEVETAGGAQSGQARRQVGQRVSGAWTDSRPDILRLLFVSRQTRQG